MPLRARDFSDDDIPAISEIHKRQPKLGVPSKKNVITNCTFVHTPDNRVVGYGVLKKYALLDFPEAVLIIDKKVSLIDKGRAVKEGIKRAIEATKKAKLETLFIFVDNKKYPGYSQILQNHFGAKVVPGQTLMIEVE